MVRRFDYPAFLLHKAKNFDATNQEAYTMRCWWPATATFNLHLIKADLMLHKSNFIYVKELPSWALFQTMFQG